MVNWRTDLTAYERRLGEVEIERAIFQDDYLDLLIFAPCMKTLILRKDFEENVFKSRQQKVNQLLFIESLNLYGKEESQISSIVDAIYKFSADITNYGGSNLKRGNIKYRDGRTTTSGGGV